MHGARKTCGSMLAALDVHPRVAMQILRHSLYASLETSPAAVAAVLLARATGSRSSAGRRQADSAEFRQR